MKNHRQQMGFITRFFIKPAKPALVRLPTGSMALDCEGHILASTLPASYSNTFLQNMGGLFLNAFRSAKQAGLPLAELTVHYSALSVVGRELGGGAIVFLSPTTDREQLQEAPPTSNHLAAEHCAVTPAASGWNT